MKTYSKFNAEASEHDMYQYVVSLGIVNIPRLVTYDTERKIMTTELIESLNVADMYTDDPTMVPDYIWQLIVLTIVTLRSNGIIYPDITGYNFIYHDEKLWIIDFEHAVCEESPAASYRMNQHADFIDEFCNWTPGMSKKWNPYFK